MEIDKHYNIADDTEIYKLWYINKNIINNDQPKFTITLPPPNITGVLHMGHALNCTIQDILIRWKKMSGYSTMWIPGVDHAGIATQNVIEKQLVAEKKTRYDIGKAALINRIWDWKQKNGTIIYQQIEKLGCLCDWDRQRFTMDHTYQEMVRDCFVKLYQDGLIYRGEKLINWCCRCETSLSNEEVNDNDTAKKLYHIKYLIADSENEYLMVATSRPETLFGDMAVACNPEDTRFQKYIGTQVIIPIINRKIPVIADYKIKPDFGTGMVKITPGSDFNDADICKRHNLGVMKIINEKGFINGTNTKYDGLHRNRARTEVLKELKALNLLCDEIVYTSKDHRCYRCDTEIEPLISTQWFLKMDEMAKMAIEHADEINFYPQYYKKIYLNWLSNIQDWCISRQIWWGHNIPAYFCQACGHIMVDNCAPPKCEKCDHHAILQDPDVLDTWFSSWLWPFAVCDTTRVPQSVVVSGFDILFFWITRMIMASLYFEKKLPFRDIYLHGVIRDSKNQKMSKSKGNTIDPLTVINTVGADALRFSLIIKSVTGSDTKLDMSCFDIGKTFRTKLWNAGRYIITKKWDLHNKNNTMINEWITGRLHETIADLDTYLTVYDFSNYADKLQRFVWDDFCSFYLEVTKFYQDADTIETLRGVFRTILLLAHPVMPFITQKLWILMNYGENILEYGWPRYFPEIYLTQNLKQGIQEIRDLITTIRHNRDAKQLICDRPKLISELDYVIKLTHCEIATSLDRITITK